MLGYISFWVPWLIRPALKGLPRDKVDFPPPDVSRPRLEAVLGGMVSPQTKYWAQ